MNITAKLLKFLYCPNIPNHADIEYAIEISKREDCYVQINYTDSAGYNYNLSVCPGDSHETVFSRLPKFYI